MSWKEVEIGNLVELRQGLCINKKSNHLVAETGLPLLRITDMINNKHSVFIKEEVPEKYIAKYEDIIYSRTGQVGLVFRHQFGVLFNNCFTVAPISNELSRDYLYWFLRCDDTKKMANDYASGAAQLDLSHSAFKCIKIKYPTELPTQLKIASILSAYDDLIENNLKRIKLLEEKAFFAYKILMSNEKLIEGKVGDLADVKSGFAFKGADWTDEGFPVIKIKNIGNNDIDLTDCSLIPENIAEAAAKFKLNAGDLLIAMTGATVGKIGMMPRTETSFYLNQRVGIFKPKIENAELFLFCFYNEPSAKDAVESLASGAAQPNISGGQLESIKLFYPKLETVTEFGFSIKSHFELIWNLKQQNTKLREARDILLPKLMNGQIEL